MHLAQGLSQIEIVRTDNGAMSINAKLEGEIGASLLRAVERYAADLVTADRLHDVAARQADAFIRIVEELSELIAADSRR